MRGPRPLQLSAQLSVGSEGRETSRVTGRNGAAKPVNNHRRLVVTRRVVSCLLMTGDLGAAPGSRTAIINTGQAAARIESFQPNTSTSSWGA
jgi:hypothetical protein